jgi:hypothetical protein
MSDFEDRMALEATADGFTDEERLRHEAAERALRLRDTRPAVIVDCSTGESISYTGSLSDATISHLERVRRDALARYGSR